MLAHACWCLVFFLNWYCNSLGWNSIHTFRNDDFCIFENLSKLLWLPSCCLYKNFSITNSLSWDYRINRIFLQLKNFYCGAFELLQFLLSGTQGWSRFRSFPYSRFQRFSFCCWRFEDGVSYQPITQSSVNLNFRALSHSARLMMKFSRIIRRTGRTLVCWSRA